MRIAKTIQLPHYNYASWFQTNLHQFRTHNRFIFIVVSMRWTHKMSFKMTHNMSFGPCVVLKLVFTLSLADRGETVSRCPTMPCKSGHVLLLPIDRWDKWRARWRSWRSMQDGRTAGRRRSCRRPDTLCTSASGSVTMLQHR